MLALLVASHALAPPKVLRGNEAKRYCTPAATLCATSILAAKEPTEMAILSSALSRDLSTRLSGRAALVTLEDDEDGLIGCAAVEIGMLSPAALDMQRLGRGADLDYDVRSRPLLSSLAVSPQYRRRGLGKKLCREVESWARSEGFDEVLLKVEQDNGRARKLYRSVGYRVVSVDREAERPEAGRNGLIFVKTTQVAMRKDLKNPPLDTVVSTAALVAAAAYVSVSFPEQLAEAASLVQAGRLADVVQLLLSGF
jgi:GNAT superfamily N-acetyltransferase